MKGVLFKKKEGAGKTNGSNGVSLFDANYKLYMESYFREMLYLERRRAERSKKPFLLMLVNLGIRRPKRTTSTSQGALPIRSTPQRARSILRAGTPTTGS